MRCIRSLVLILLILCTLFSSCTPIDPSKVIEEDTDGGAPLWPYTPSDDKPLIGNVLIPGERELLYYDGGVCVRYFGGPFREWGVWWTKNMFSTLRRIDIATGEVTFVCPDPLCDHKLATCPFNGMVHGVKSLFFIDADGNIIYYRNVSADTSDEKQYHAQLCTYNLNTKKWKIHYDEVTDDSTDTFSDCILCYGGNLYYYKAEYKE